MEAQLTNMLDLMRRPAFCVEAGVICHINPAAKQYFLSSGAAIRPLIIHGQAEYDEYSDGTLYLTLAIGPQTLGAEVVCMDERQVFLLEEPESTAELRAMALAAKELRGPLTGILALSGQLVSKAAADPDTQTQAAQMNRRIFQLMRIVSNMSDAFRYSQPDTGRMEFVQVTAFYDELFQGAAGLLESAGIQLLYSGPNEPVFTLADPELLERAAYNLLSNAAKYASKPGVIHAQLRRRRDRLYLSVADNGPGIENSVKSSIYSRYLREPMLEDSRFGIGLGMVLIRATASQHGGAVLVDQRDGQGSRTTMTMAIRQPRQNILRSPSMHIDYAGEWDHSLLELSDCLPPELYRSID